MCFVCALPRDIRAELHAMEEKDRKSRRAMAAGLVEVGFPDATAPKLAYHFSSGHTP